MDGLNDSVKDDRVIVGFNGKDDAAVYRIDKDRYLVQTVDFFTPVVDDPYQFGQIAAANSLSDIYAMGATPRFALNIVGFPITQLPREMLTRILQGGTDKASEAGIPILGGHSVDDKEPKYGMVVTGEVSRNQLITNDKARPGDVLILTKPLGTGIIASAIKKGVASKASTQAAIASMSLLNKQAAESMQQVPVHAATDITGFGLLGHLLELCQASRVSATIKYDQLAFLPGVRQLAEKQIIPGGSKRNLSFVADRVAFSSDLSPEARLMCADAQTSGGLLIALPEEAVEAYLTSYNARSPFPAIVVGRLLPTTSDKIITVA